MSLLTNWGYTLADADIFADMLTDKEFNELTGNKYSTDGRIKANISAACSAIRNYCGWHVYPSEICKLETTFYDNRIRQVRRGTLIQLPATYVSAVTSIMIGEAEHEAYVIESNGILRLYDVDYSGVHRHTPIILEYVAGIPVEMMYGLKELIAHRVTHALASSAGVQSETAGGVSITYNATWTNNSRATALADDNKEVLQPYRIQGVF